VPEISNPFSAESAARRAATLLVNLARRCSTRARSRVRIDRRSFLPSLRPGVEQAESAADRVTVNSGAMASDARVQVDRAAVERSWKERGFSCGLWVDPPGQVWSDYVHDTDELVMVVEGDVEFEIDGKAHRPSPGEELLIPARARHTVRNLGRGESRWLYGYGR
jgi:quercetin dioxygenase-like cupin family protein